MTEEPKLSQTAQFCRQMVVNDDNPKVQEAAKQAIA